MLGKPDFPSLAARPWPRFSFAGVFKDFGDHSVSPNRPAARRLDAHCS